MPCVTHLQTISLDIGLQTDAFMVSAYSKHALMVGSNFQNSCMHQAATSIGLHVVQHSNLNTLM